MHIFQYSSLHKIYQAWPHVDAPGESVVITYSEVITYTAKKYVAHKKKTTGGRLFVPLQRFSLLLFNFSFSVLFSLSEQHDLSHVLGSLWQLCFYLCVFSEPASGFSLLLYAHFPYIPFL